METTMEHPPSTGRPGLTPLVWVVAAGLVLLQMSAAGRYGVFRDELYYLMCADHLAWGYVDHPPLSIAVLAGWRAVFGDGVWALRILPALLNGWAALGTALLAREMGGRTLAQTCAAILGGFMPVALAIGGFFSMNPFDLGFWVLIVWIVCRLLGDGSRRWWWGLGIAFGLGLLNKYSVVFLGVGLGLGILLSPLRHELLSSSRLIGTLIVLGLVTPHLVWQITQGWPTLEFVRRAQEFKIARLSVGEFWGEQILMANPGFLPVAILGLVGLLFLPRLRTWRPFGVAFVVVGFWLTVQNAKPYYLAPAFPMILAAGAVLLEHWLSLRRKLLVAGWAALPLLFVGVGLAIAPLVIPLLSVEDYIAYEQRLGLRPRNMETGAVGALPQHFADRFGWPELAAAVVGVFNSLPAEDQDSCLIVAGNYGECGAINYFGRGFGLPTAVSGHNSCWSWWPEEGDWAVVLAVGPSRKTLEQFFTHVTAGGRRTSAQAMPGERDLTIWICRGWKMDPAEVRLLARSYI
jgi:hypothetical protein